VQDTNQTSLTLPPQSVKVIDAMAEVAGIPRKQGDATIDLSPFTQRDTWRQEDNWFEPEKPYEELVEDMRALVQQGRADYPETDTKPFNPAAWLGWYLQGLAEREAVGQQRYGDVKTAWDALAYTYYPAEGGAQRDRELARWQLEGYVSYTNQTSLILPPESAKVLDAMAEVAGIPRKRGEATIDLSSFATPSGNNQTPTTRK